MSNYQGDIPPLTEAHYRDLVLAVYEMMEAENPANAEEQISDDVAASIVDAILDDSSWVPNLIAGHAVSRAAYNLERFVTTSPDNHHHTLRSIADEIWTERLQVDQGRYRSLLVENPLAMAAA